MPWPLGPPSRPRRWPTSSVGSASSTCRSPRREASRHVCRAPYPGAHLASEGLSRVLRHLLAWLVGVHTQDDVPLMTRQGALFMPLLNYTTWPRSSKSVCHMRSCRMAARGMSASATPDLCYRLHRPRRPNLCKLRHYLLDSCAHGSRPYWSSRSTRRNIVSSLHTVVRPTLNRRGHRRARHRPIRLRRCARRWTCAAGCRKVAPQR
jgi:hypothetical protein